MARFKGRDLIFDNSDKIIVDDVEIYKEDSTVKIINQDVTHDKSITDKEYVDSITRNKNLIINGNFDIWQRNTTQTVDGYGSDDRWKNHFSGGSMENSRQIFVVGQTDVPNNPRYYSRIVVVHSANSNHYCIKQQAIEDVRRTSGKTITLSFYANAGSNINIAISFMQWFGTGGTPSDRVETATGLVALTTSWEKHTVTVDIPSISGKTIGTNNDDSLIVRFWLSAGSDHDANSSSLGAQSGTFRIGQVQVEEGDVATQFENRTVGEELILCQRYFEKSVRIDVVPANGVARHVQYGAYAYGGSNARLQIPFIVTKRGNPTLTIYRTVDGSTNGQAAIYNGSWVSASGTVLDTISSNTFSILLTVSGAFTAFSTYLCSVCWTVDAEL